MAFSFVYISVRTFFEGVFQMKKWTSLFLIAVLAAVWLTAVPTVSAQTADAYDLLFEETMTVFLEDQGQDGAAYTSHKELLYDVSLEPLGAIYTYELAGECGYTVIINSNGGYEVTESFFGREDPYAGCTGLRIYVLSFVYWEYVDGHFIDLGTDEILTDERVDSFLNTTYGVFGDEVSYQNEAFQFVTKNEVEYKLAHEYPCFYTQYLTRGDCVSVAGANLIIYFDRFYENLIPNYTPGTDGENGYAYYDFPMTTFNALNDDLFVRMGDEDGISTAEFRSGFASYVNDKGLYTSCYACMSNTSFNYSVAKSRINAGMPLILFLRELTMTSSVTEENNQEKILHTRFTGTQHAVSAYGYKEIQYTLPDGSVRLDRFLAVAVGDSFCKKGYLSVDRTIFVNAYAVEIYE